MDDTTRPATTPDLLGRGGHDSTLPAVAVDQQLPIRRRTRCWVAAIGAVLALAAAVLAMVDAASHHSPTRNKRDTPVGVYLFALAFLVALELAMYAYRQARIARTLRGASWQRSALDVATIGSGKRTQQRLHLLTVDEWFRPTYYLSSPSGLKKRADEVEWTGNLDGHIVVRRPGSDRLALYYIARD